MPSIGPTNDAYSNYKRTIDNLQDDFKKQEQKSRQSNQEQIDSLEDKQQMQLRKKDETAERVIQSVKESADESIVRERTSNRTDIERLRAENYDRFGKNAQELSATQKRAANAVNAAEAEMERKSTRSDVRYQDRLLTQDQENAKRLEQNAEMERRSRSTEVRDLKDSLMAYRDQDSAAKTMKIAEQAKENNETEHDWRVKLENVQSNADREIAKRNHTISAIEETSADKHAKALREKSDAFTKVINEQNTSQHDDEKYLVSAFETNQKASEQSMSRERQLTQKNHEDRLGAVNERSNKALTEQAHTYQQTLARNHQEDNEKINSLQQNINTLKTTDQVALISPAVENAIRKNVSDSYEVTLAAERERNATGYENLKTNAALRFRDQVSESATKETAMSRESALEQQRLRSELNGAIRDTEMNRDATLKEQDSSHSREIDATHRNNSEVMGQMRRRYEEIIQTHQDESRTKVATLRQEAEFNSRMTHRAFSTQQNELIREYEKKLTEQKALSTSDMNELKGQMDVAVRDSERKQKSALDEQARTYEQRIAQLDLQQKEHERVLTRNHDEELEKVKRSNALLISKKS
ncbi:MAG: hypothetical protein H7222_03360 [Methylotenera sp.]|nr:hypothetical protein [Oligoflexia bacterium]